MALERLSLQAIQLNGATPVTLKQVDSEDISYNPQVITNSGAGSFAPSYGVMADVAPRVDFSTSEISRTLAAVSVLAGLGIKSGNTYTDFYSFWSRKATHSTRQGSSAHYRASMSSCMLLPKSVTAQNNSEAKMSLSCMGVSTDGATAIMAWTDSVSLPASVYADEKFTLGPIKIGSTTLDGIEEATLDFGLEADARKQHGNPYHEFPSVSKSAPVLSFKSSNLSLASTYTQAGATAASAITFYLRKYQTATQTYSNGSSQHISFVIPASQWMIIPENTSGSGSDDAMISYRIHIFEGSSTAITVATGQTIT